MKFQIILVSDMIESGLKTTLVLRKVVEFAVISNPILSTLIVNLLITTHQIGILKCKYYQ